MASKQHQQWASDSNKSLPINPLACCYQKNSCTLSCSEDVIISSSRILPRYWKNEQNSEVNAYNRIKTAEHVALWSFWMPSCTCRCLYVKVSSFYAIGQSNSLAQVQDLCAKALKNLARTPS